jgi:hypothetical protein
MIGFNLFISLSDPLAVSFSKWIAANPSPQ